MKEDDGGLCAPGIRTFFNAVFLAAGKAPQRGSGNRNRKAKIKSGSQTVAEGSSDFAAADAGIPLSFPGRLYAVCGVADREWMERAALGRGNVHGIYISRVGLLWTGVASGAFLPLGGCKKKGKREASGYFSPVGTGSFRSECFGNDGAFIGGYREHAADVEIITQP
ncbi:MAG: hypothetical protein KHW46_02795 [Clostridiales bacterium]|nr:hypothetical protein [Clostridiales bacterium]